MRGAVEDYPFGDEVAVFKVEGKMFALVSLLGEPGSVNLKCDPDWALELRATHDAVRPGYHQNKRHWNTVELDGTVEDAELREMIDHSYELVVSGLPRKPTNPTPRTSRSRSVTSSWQCRPARRTLVGASLMWRYRRAPIRETERRRQAHRRACRTACNCDACQISTSSTGRATARSRPWQACRCVRRSMWPRRPRERRADSIRT